MGGGNSKLQGEVDSLKNERAKTEIRHKNAIAALTEKLDIAQTKRDEALRMMKRLEATMEKERKESQAEIARLKANQEEMMERIKELIEKFNAQEALYRAQLELARKENAELRKKIDELVDMLKKEREEHAKEMAAMQARGEELIKMIQEENRRQAEEDRKKMLEEIARLMNNNNNKPVTASGQVSAEEQDRAILEMNKREEAKINRQICRMQKMVESNAMAELQAVTDLLKDHPESGVLIARLVDHTNLGKLAMDYSSCGAGNKWFPQPIAALPAHVSLIA